jgi:hypothetical protein
MFICAAVLTANLLTPGCGKDVAAPKPETHRPVHAHVAEELPMVIFTDGRQVVRKEDGIMTIGFTDKKSGDSSWNVTKIDGDGIEVGMKGEEQAAHPQLRISYGETRTSDVFGLPLTIKAEKAPEPGTAFVTVAGLNQDAK